MKHGHPSRRRQRRGCPRRRPPMSRRLVLFTVTALLMAVPARAQFVVIDPGNLVQAILIADRTLQEYHTPLQQYQTIVRMAQGLGSLDQYRIPTIGITG